MRHLTTAVSNRIKLVMIIDKGGEKEHDLGFKKERPSIMETEYMFNLEVLFLPKPPY